MNQKDKVIQLGFIGHVGHGKTSLSQALMLVSTGESDYVKEDNIRGIVFFPKPQNYHKSIKKD